MAKPYITVRNLHKSYKNPAGANKVLTGIDLEISSGDFVAIVGASGIGKTTLLNMLTGVDSPNEGTITIGDQDISDTGEALTKWRARNIGIVFQLFQLLPTLTVAENVAFPMDFTNTHPADQRLQIAINLLGKMMWPC